MSSRHPPALGSQFKNIEIKVSTMGKGSIIGLNDYLSKKPYSTSVRCSSCNGTILAIKADEFRSKMINNSQNWEKLLLNALEKDVELEKAIELIGKVDVTKIEKGKLIRKPNMQNYISIMSKHNVKDATEKTHDFRLTMKEIV